MKMRARVITLSLLALAAVFTGCQTPVRLTKAEAFPLMYMESPHVVAVLPPINVTTSADAKDYYGTTIAEPLNQLGYYTIPIEILNDILEAEGLTDTEVFKDQSMRRFGDILGADAVLITEIKQWDKDYMVVSSTLTISIDARLISTKTDQLLWNYNGTIVVDLSGNSGNAIANLIVTAIQTAMADYVEYARLANANLLYSLPAGRYHPLTGTDGTQLLTFPPGVTPTSLVTATPETTPGE